MGSILCRASLCVHSATLPVEELVRLLGTTPDWSRAKGAQIGVGAPRPREWSTAILNSPVSDASPTETVVALLDLIAGREVAIRAFADRERAAPTPPTWGHRHRPLYVDIAHRQTTGHAGFELEPLIVTRLSALGASFAFSTYVGADDLGRAGFSEAPAPLPQQRTAFHEAAGSPGDQAFG